MYADRNETFNTDIADHGRSNHASRIERTEEDPNLNLQLSGLSILFIDDTPDIRMLYSRMLRKAGARVFLAESAKEARAALSLSQPDLIVCDIAMPDEDGLTFIEDLRRSERRQGFRIPAIALTAFVGSDFRAMTLRSGFDFHLCKPASLQLLIGTIAAVLAPKSPVRH